MASNYVVQTQRRTVQAVGPNQVLDVEEVGFETRPSGVYAQVTIPLLSWRREGAAVFIEPIAEGIENTLARADVADMTFVQEVTAQGLLEDLMEVTVQLPPTAAQPWPQSSTVTIAVGVFGTDPAIRNMVIERTLDPIVKALQATADL